LIEKSYNFGVTRDLTATTSDDTELLRRTADGDQTAFASLYDRYSPRIYGLIVRLFRNRNCADDVFQDVFWQIWRLAGRFDPSRARADVWLLLLTRSRAVDYLRRQGRQPPVVGEFDLPGVADPTLPPQTAESSAKVRSALAQLPDDQRHALCLAFYAGMTHEQIAGQESLPLGTVKSRIRRGMERLRHVLHGEGE